MEKLDFTDDRWEEMRGGTVESRFELAEPVQFGVRSGIFRAFDSGVAQREVFVFLENGADKYADDNLNRYREASFLAHANLLRLFETGRTRIQGVPYIYAVTETAESSLREFTRQKALDPAEGRELAMQLIAALAYLHSENLVYCALRPESVWRAGTQWKLADYSQLRVPGVDQETRRLLTDSNYVSPPEAYHGIVTPAWDVWSLASTLQMTLKAGPLPVPFDEIARDSLVPDRASRLTLSQIAEFLSRPVSSIPIATRPSLLFHATIPALAEDSTPEQAAVPERKRAGSTSPISSASPARSEPVDFPIATRPSLIFHPAISVPAEDSSPLEQATVPERKRAGLTSPISSESPSRSEPASVPIPTPSSRLFLHTIRAPAEGFAREQVAVPERKRAWLVPLQSFIDAVTAAIRRATKRPQ